MYNPYFTSYPYIQTNPSIFSRLFGNINFSSILSGTQKTLNIVNQTIPLIKQASPIVKNAKTMFKVMNEFKKVESTPSINNSKEDVIKAPDNTTNYDNGPTFFI